VSQIPRKIALGAGHLKRSSKSWTISLPIRAPAFSGVIGPMEKAVESKADIPPRAVSLRGMSRGQNWRLGGPLSAFRGGCIDCLGPAAFVLCGQAFIPVSPKKQAAACCHNPEGVASPTRAAISLKKGPQPSVWKPLENRWSNSWTGAIRATPILLQKPTKPHQAQRRASASEKGSAEEALLMEWV